MDENKALEFIYVQLLNEGVDVFRPVSAIKITEQSFILQGNDIYDPENEQWEFLPGTCVIVQRRHLSCGNVLVAIKADAAN